VRISHNLKAVSISMNLSIATIFILALLVLPSCSSKSTVDIKGDVPERSAVSGEPEELNISAAASLKDALLSLSKDFEEKENARLVFNFASSGDLQVQIERGAPADVFLSAGKKQMDAVASKGLIDINSRLDLLSNDLVVIVPEKSKVDVSTVKELVKLGELRRIAIGMPEASPAGKYAKEALQAANIWPDMQNKLILAKDVNQIINYVETGNVDAGFVYASDAYTAKNSKIALKVPAELHEPITYPVAALKNATNPELAAKYIEYLQSEKASGAFARSGFKVAD